MIKEWVEYLTETFGVGGSAGEFFAAVFTVGAAVVGGVAGAALAIAGGSPLSAVGGALVGLFLLWPAVIAHIWFFIQWRKEQ